MIHTLGGIVAGLAVAMLLIMGVEGIGNQLFPKPMGYDLNQGSALSLPFETLIWPVIGWFLGVLVGAWLAVRISARPWTGWAVAALVLAAAIFNFALITHPVWMMVAGAIAPLVGAGIGIRLARTGEARGS